MRRLASLRGRSGCPARGPCQRTVGRQGRGRVGASRPPGRFTYPRSMHLLSRHGCASATTSSLVVPAPLPTRHAVYPDGNPIVGMGDRSGWLGPERYRCSLCHGETSFLSPRCPLAAALHPATQGFDREDIQQGTAACPNSRKQLNQSLLSTAQRKDTIMHTRPTLEEPRRRQERCDA